MYLRGVQPRVQVQPWQLPTPTLHAWISIKILDIVMEYSLIFLMYFNSHINDLMFTFSIMIYVLE